MQYYSILFETNENETQEKGSSMPDFFQDLNLDQVIQEILSYKEEYNLNEFYYQSLKEISTINYRLDVMRELESIKVFNCVVNFSGKMKKVREYIGFSKEAHNIYQRQKWFLDAADLYCVSVYDLHNSFIEMDLHSKGLSLFNNWLTEYIYSDNFRILQANTNNLNMEFGSVKYSVQIERDKIIVGIDDYEEDYCASLNETFEQINEVAFDYQIKFFTGFEMCVLESKILENVRTMNKEAFNKLEVYCETHADFFDRTVKNFDREVQFYIAYLEYITKLKHKGYRFAYPEVSCIKKLQVQGGYDIALAYKAIGSGESIISNDFSLDSSERIYVLTGPNQGGKTTFARAFGQIHFLASIGCPVPCQKAELYLYDKIFTHFSKEENLSTNAGRLKEELVRLKPIMEEVTANSIVIINELFATTTSYDSYIMGKKVLDHLVFLDCMGLYVTHIPELASINKKTVSLVATVNSEQDTVRTYKIFRKQADGYAYANSIAQKYNLSYRQIKERIRI